MNGKVVDLEASTSSSSSKETKNGTTPPTTTLSPSGGPNPFEDIIIRRNFISKVLGILIVMLLVTFVVMAVFLFVDSAKAWMQQYGMVVSSVAFGIYIFTSLFLICCSQSVGRTVPWNYILLTIFTLCFACFITPMVIRYDLQSVLLSLGITVVLVVLVTVLSICTSFDFTRWICVIALTIIGFCICSFVIVFVALLLGVPVNWLMLVQAGVGVVVFMLSLALEVQLIVGGRRFSYSPEDYVLATINIYLDILYIFIYILRIVGSARS